MAGDMKTQMKRITHTHNQNIKEEQNQELIEYMSLTPDSNTAENGNLMHQESQLITN